MATAAEHRAEIDRINGEVATQAAKIAQLSTILDGKAAGGGGSVETCTVNITIESRAAATCLGCTYTIFQNGIINGVSTISSSQGATNMPSLITNVVKGGYIIIMSGQYYNSPASSDSNVEIIARVPFSATYHCTIIRVLPDAANEFSLYLTRDV